MEPVTNRLQTLADNPAPLDEKSYTLERIIAGLENLKGKTSGLTQVEKLSLICAVIDREMTAMIDRCLQTQAQTEADDRDFKTKVGQFLNQFKLI
jgi:hypothetical protein